ncbi:hypothetical protein BVY03_02885 [bacterium K02(2017)]|nr:hypothetical protein BVY03_02885 [bacterium K02(2017)]
MPSLTAKKLSEIIQLTPDIKLIDVREEDEYLFCKINGAKNIPISQIKKLINTSQPNESIYLYCHRGLRAKLATQHMHQIGFNNVYYLEGGIEKWSLDIDKKVLRY